MDLDQLRDQWKSIDLNVDRLAKENRKLRRQLVYDRISTINQRLVRRFKNMSVICLSSPLLFVLSNRIEHVFSDYTMAVTCIALVVMGVMHMFFISKLNDESYLTCPMIESIRNVTYRIRLLRRIKAIDLILGGSAVVMMFYDLYNYWDKELILMPLIGGIVGGIAGYRVSRTNRRLLRQLYDILKELDESGDTSRL